MGHAQESSKAAFENEGTPALKEMEDFQTHPHSIGLDNIKESLRTVVQLMLELKGHRTGYEPQVLLDDTHASMAMDGPMIDAIIKKKSDQEFWDWLLKLEEMIDKSFHTLIKLVTKKIKVIINDIAEEIEDIAEEIAEVEEHIKDTSIPTKTGMKAKLHSKKAKKAKLVKFKEHVEQHKEELNDATTGKEVMQIHENVVEDLKDFQENPNSFTPALRVPSPFLSVPVLADTYRAKNDIDYGEDPYPNHPSTSGKGKGDKGESGDTGSGSGDDTTGEGGDDAQEKETKPDLPSIDY